MKLFGFVLGFFHRETPAVAAILAGIAPGLFINRTLKECEAGKGFKLAMGGRRQPEERCQGKHDVSEMPHASIDSGR